MKQENQNKTNNPSSESSMTSEQYSRFYSFFLLPLMIAVLGSLFFIAGRSITSEDNGFSKLIGDINNGSHSKRWHAAYRLGVELSSGSNSKAFPNTIQEKNMLINAYKNSIDYEKSINDNKKNSDKYNLRAYLIVAMGRTRDIYYGETLLDGLNSDSPVIRIATIQSLGNIQYAEASDKIIDLIDFSNCCKENIGIETITCKTSGCIDDIETLTAVIALGKIGNKTAIPLLKEMLKHEQPNITWDAAIALAKMNDDSGKHIINNLLDRKFYSNYKNIDKKETNNSILVALEISSKIKDPLFKENISYLASELESNPEVRAAARVIKKTYD